MVCAILRYTFHPSHPHTLTPSHPHTLTLTHCRHIRVLVSYYASVSKLQRLLSRRLLKLWEGQSQHVQVLSFLVCRELTLLTPHPSLHTTLKVTRLPSSPSRPPTKPPPPPLPLPLPPLALSLSLSLSLSAEVVSDVCSECEVHFTGFSAAAGVHEELRRGDDLIGRCHRLPARLCVHQTTGTAFEGSHHLRREGDTSGTTLTSLSHTHTHTHTHTQKLVLSLPSCIHTHTYIVHTYARTHTYSSLPPSLSLSLSATDCQVLAVYPLH